MWSSLRRAFLLLIATISVVDCGPKAPPAFFSNPLPLLTWMGEFTRPAGSAYPQLKDSSKYGSISGLAPDERRKEWVGVIDDRERSRLVWLNVDFGTGGLQVAPVRMQELSAAPGVDTRRVMQADLEAIVALRDGRFVMSEEGHLSDLGAWQPALLLSTHDGVVTHIIEFPKEFRITGDGKTGLRDNQGFEGLAITPRGHLIAGMEQPLIQDGSVTFERGGPGRLVEFEPSGATFKASRQWRYQISPTPYVENFDETCSDG